MANPETTTIPTTGSLTRTDDGMGLGWDYENIKAAATTVVKSGRGILHSIVVNTPVASDVITIYDDTTATGTEIATITLPSTLLSNGPLIAIYDATFKTGLTVKTASTSNVTVNYI